MTRNIDEFHRLRAIETDDCVEWPYGKNKGYGQLRFDGRRHHAHRLALVLATAMDPPDMDAAHGPCHNRACMNVRHLSWKTRAENAADVYRDGTDQQGERSSCAKLTEKDVREIRETVGSTYELAARYGVSHMTISRIRRRTRWTHI